MKKFRLTSIVALVTALITLGVANAQTQIFLPVVSTTLEKALCPDWVHDRHVVKGPDGKDYPTWHPQIDPIHRCYFSHEHGDDPTRSLADSSLPAFGYIGAQAGMDEPHPGFKVFVINKGERNNEGRVASAHTRAVAHMGTSGQKRFSERMHSLEFDLVAPDTGHVMHVQGMADTGLPGDICQRDKTTADNTFDGDIGRVFFIKPSVNVCKDNGSYEIWKFTLKLAGRAEVNVSTASFDTATMMNPQDLTELLPTGKFGCNRESYHGPAYWYNESKPMVFYTDAFGKAGGGVRQEVSARNDVTLKLNADQNQMKMMKNNCAPGLSMPN
jgi:hypothetical protein